MFSQCKPQYFQCFEFVLINFSWNFPLVDVQLHQRDHVLTVSFLVLNSNGNGNLLWYRSTFTVNKYMCILSGLIKLLRTYFLFFRCSIVLINCRRYGTCSPIRRMLNTNYGNLKKTKTTNIYWVQICYRVFMQNLWIETIVSEQITFPWNPHLKHLKSVWSR